MSYPPIILKKNEDARLRRGHLWIFSNEIDTERSPLHQFTPGDLVEVINAKQQSYGIAYLNPNTLICARLLSRKRNIRISQNFFEVRFTTALKLRERWFALPFYRLVYGEADGLPGLIVDRFGDTLSVQMTTAGMDRQINLIIDALVALLKPTCIVLKNDTPARNQEGLPLVNELAFGERSKPLIIEENGTKFKINIEGGQKTGWYYDHRYGRAQLAKLAHQQRVLDLFSYSGAWGIPAAIAGAKEVQCIDSSASALELAKENALLNGVQNHMQFLQHDVFDFLKQARLNQDRYDIIVLDPPALIKRKKDAKAGLEAYRRLNQMAMQVLNTDGILVSASCSHHLNRAQLHEILRASARHVDRHLSFVSQTGQGPDHPIHPAIPETDYLKTFFCATAKSL
ncbi:MAG: class I SAM-dependent rRNA methyltransferase [Methylococcaceae bacterium]